MKNRHLLCIAVCICTLIFMGCETTKQTGQAKPKPERPAKDNRPIDQRLRAGMTKEEVRSAIGEPADKAVKSTGEESWTYKDTAKAWIPFYVIGGGKFNFLTVNFGPDGKVKDWATSKHGMY